MHLEPLDSACMPCPIPLPLPEDCMTISGGCKPYVLLCLTSCTAHTTQHAEHCDLLLRGACWTRPPCTLQAPEHIVSACLLQPVTADCLV